MHSKNRESNKKWVRALATSGVALAALALAGTAGAHERGHRHHHDRGYDIDSRHGRYASQSVREARRYDRRLDRRGDVIDFKLDLLALVAAANGEYALAEHLDRKGDRIERRLDRKGDRALRNARLDRRRDREDRFDRKWHKRERRLEKKRERARRLDRMIERERKSERRDDRDRRISRKRERREKRSHVEALAQRVHRRGR